MTMAGMTMAGTTMAGTTMAGTTMVGTYPLPHAGRPVFLDLSFPRSHLHRHLLVDEHLRLVVQQVLWLVSQHYGQAGKTMKQWMDDKQTFLEPRLWDT